MMDAPRRIPMRGRSAFACSISHERPVEAAAFVDVLMAPQFVGRTIIHYDGGDIARMLDLHTHLAEPRPGAHLYCCGPRGLMESVREAARHWPPGTVHFEDFGTSAHPGAGTEAFYIRLARSGEVLERHGHEVPNACRAGTCGTCRTAVLAGIPDHRDFVLDDEQQKAAMMVCVSRALTDEITLDL